MSTRRRVLSIRVAEPEYQILKTVADQAGVSVPIHIRRLALDSIQQREIVARLDGLSAAIQALPDRAALVEVARRLAERIDRSGATKGATP